MEQWGASNFFSCMHVGHTREVTVSRETLTRRWRSPVHEIEIFPVMHTRRVFVMVRAIVDDEPFDWSFFRVGDHLLDPE